ncbi:MAG: DUF885 domain-containing protein [Nocardioides sp.]
MELTDVAREFQAFRCGLEPSWAHLIGEYEYADRFEDVSAAGEADACESADRFAALAESQADSDPEHELSWRVMHWEATSRRAVLGLGLAELQVDPLFGPLASLPVELANQALPTSAVAARLPVKYAAIARHVRDRVDRLHDGLARGRVPVGFAVAGEIALVERWLATPPHEDPMLALPPTSTDTDRARLLDELTTVLGDQVRPALVAYLDCLRAELAPAARSDAHCGLSWVEGGDEAYAALARFHTSTDVEADEAHRIGLEHVAALEEEYAELGQAALGICDPGEVRRSLRDDPTLHFDTVEEVLAAARTALARATSATGPWFGRVPAVDCTVEAATSGSLAYYFRPPRDGSRGGICFVNVSHAPAWARYEIEALMYHEGVPGHHLQIGLTGELDHLPEFRRTGRITGFSEGWGLYAERLADEMGLYSAPLDRLGMLTFDSLRACRLVVDTGIHAQGWSRDRARTFLAEHSPLSPEHVAAEVDRYVVTPGQALAYLVGRRELLRVRAEAEARLGPTFDLARFHDALLSEGQLPLSLVDAQVRRAYG